MNPVKHYQNVTGDIFLHFNLLCYATNKSSTLVFLSCQYNFKLYSTLFTFTLQMILWSPMCEYVYCAMLSTLVPGLSSGIIFLMVWCCIPPSLNGFKSMIYQKCAANCPSWGQLDLGPGTDWEISSNWNEREAFFCWERKRKLTFTFQLRKQLKKC